MDDAKDLADVKSVQLLKTKNPAITSMFWHLINSSSCATIWTPDFGF